MALLVYLASWCPDCRTAKRAMPQFVIDGNWVQPYRADEVFLYEEMSQLLGVVDEG